MAQARIAAAILGGREAAMIFLLLVVLCMVLGSVVAIAINGQPPKRKPKCYQGCGLHGWTVTRTDEGTLHRRCNRCGWIGRYYQPHK